MTNQNVKAADLAKVMSVDFANQFGKSMASLMDVFGIGSLETIAAGTQLKQYKVAVEGGLKKQTEEGELIPLTNVKQTCVDTFTVEIEPYAKGTSVQAILKSGYDTAVAKTDQALMRAIRADVRNRFFEMLKKGTGKAEGTDLPSAIAMGKAVLENELSENNDECEAVAVFINPLDQGAYLANAELSNQGKAFGMAFYSNVLGVTQILTDSRVPQGTTYITPAENIHCYVPDQDALAQAGFDFAIDETGVVAVHHTAKYENGTAMTYVNTGLTLVPEVKNYIIKSTIKPAAVKAAQPSGE